jgi:hypothetical protein
MGQNSKATGSEPLSNKHLPSKETWVETSYLTSPWTFTGYLLDSYPRSRQ